MRFLGVVVYYRKFCHNFSVVASPLTNLRKSVIYVWSDHCMCSFEALKALLASEPVLAAPDFNHPFILEVDASDVGIGSVLLQKDADDIAHHVCYFSRKLDKHQQNYSTIEKETLALILSLQQFKVYLCGSPHTTLVYTDHNPLVFISKIIISKMKNQNQRLLKWCSCSRSLT